MRFKLTLVTAALASISALFALSPGLNAARPAGGGNEQGTYTITIKDFTFTPRDLVIPAGSKVIWINKDEEPHKIAEVNSNFGSQPLDTDGSFTYEFKSAGKFEYFCTLHPRMTGHILVGGK
jgi:plastocyanin